MVVPLAGYSTRRILRASPRAQVYEAVRKRDDRPVVAKVFELRDGGVEARVEHEFRLLQQLDVEGVVQTLGIERAGDQLVLLLDYIAGSNLAQFTGGQPMTVDQFLPTALSLAATLARVHERRVVHRDIKPSNVLVESETGAVFLVDFGISVLLERERAHLYDPEVLAGTLPYVSPEQTGRTTHEVDFRSDLYSLGATFYELLTGRRPFEAAEPLELIHAHLARRPKPPNELVALPRTIAAIVMKLLEKAPEHRYQSASGLLADLERFAAARARGELDPAFALGGRDHPTTLQLPHQLYARAGERAAIERAFEAVREHGQRRLVLLAGGPGLGKTALLRTIAAPVSAAGGYVAIGDFGGHGRTQPYAGFIAAFASLVEQILTESDERMASWRERLGRALGPIAGVAAAMIPELAMILGELPPVPALELAEGRNRLHLALARFVSAFAEVGPLAVLLDDLHRADSESVELLRALLDEGAERPVLFVASYREDALAEDHPLRALIARPQVTGLALRPLSVPDLEAMLRDVLGREGPALTELARQVSRKTGGSPLLVRQLLLRLEAERLLQPSPTGWRWQPEQVAAASPPEDLLEVMQLTLAELEPGPRALLELAACAGPRFEASALEGGSGRPREAVAAALFELERRGLIHPSGQGYAFGLERIREAVLEAIDPETRRGLHWRLGEHLLARHGCDPETLGERLFEIIDQLDGGLPMADLPQPRRSLLVTLNTHAGQRSLDRAAWGAARRYFELAADLLEAAAEPHPLAFAATFGRAQAMALQGDTSSADAAFAALLERPLSQVERARVLARRVRILELREQVDDALATALAALAEFGVELPAEPRMAQVALAFIRAQRALARIDRETLLTRAPVSDPREDAILHLLDAARGPAWFKAQNLWAMITAHHVERCVRAGHHPTAPHSLGSMAMVLITMAKVPQARALVEDAVALASARSSTPAAAISARANSLTMVGPQCRPFCEVAGPAEAAQLEAIEAGERDAAGLIAAFGLINHLEAGTHLREIIELDARVRAVDDSFGTPEFKVVADFTSRLIAVMAGVEGASFMTLDEVSVELSSLTRYAVICGEVWGRALLGEVDEAWALVEPLLGDYERVLMGSVVVPRVAMLAAFLAARRSLGRGPRQRRVLLACVRRQHKVISRWAEICPQNYAAMAALVSGELAAMRGKSGRALRQLEAAHALATKHDAHYVAGLASLAIADWAGREGLGSAREGALLRARAAFEEFGAWGLVAALDARHGLGGHLSPSASQTLTQTLTHNTSLDAPAAEGASPSHPRLLSASLGAGNSGLSLDLATLLSTMQIINEALDLEQVISRVLGAAIENAGADHGLLLLERDDELTLVAEGGAREPAAFMAEPVPLALAHERLPVSAVHYVLRTGSAVVVDDVADSRFAADPYLRREGVRSLLCMAIVKPSGRVGALVLENRLTPGVFSAQRLEILRILLAPAASALDNARLYAALARSEAQWRSLVDGMPDIIALMDAQGRLEFVNHLQPYAADPSVVIGLNTEQSLAEASREVWREAFASVVAGGGPREIEICISPAGMPARWYMTRLAPVAGGDVTKYLSISTDITQRKQLEAQVRQQQRLESIGTLASGVAHEINNPVQGILNYAELIHEHAEDCGTVREFSAEITQESERVATIVRDLLAFSRQEVDLQRERVSVPALVEATLSLVRAVMRKDDVRVLVDLPEDLPEVHCRAQQIQQIIMNLVTNARDALNERYPGFHDDKRIEFSAAAFTRAGLPWVRLSVADRGAGIPEPIRARIFDPFFTTKGRDKGTGLGLAVSHGIATDHGGELHVESEAGVGTRFHLELPAQAAASSQAEQPDRADQAEQLDR
ncbi:AAA family ATPase [Pseudenhygromyxa sp. WMMC2535]|uniref:protein kinase domain-containing protein n=1 Tax=Pseudenhygromyxa sp. WMMC2535 TaxID=2712867 RepID=UPI00155788B1|nr:AAA family ATPase [Pseudenhygromyxa sp. WMMC2535]